MKKALSLIVLATAALGLAFSVGGHRGGDDWNDHQCPTCVDRGAQVTGAWLIVADFGNGLFESEMQFFADGQRGDEQYRDQRRQRPSHHRLGRVENQIGKRTIAMTLLIQIVAETASTKFYEKVVGEVTVEGDVLSGEGAGRVYLPTQDPLNPEETPLQVLSGPVVGRRIGVERL